MSDPGVSQMIAGTYPVPMAQEPGRPPAKYRQIADDLRARIEGGEYPVGAQLPTKAELEDAYGAALGTVDNALAALRDTGLVETRHGAGTFVLRQHPDQTEAEQVGQMLRRLEDVSERLGKVEDRLSAAEEALQRDGL